MPEPIRSTPLSKRKKLRYKLIALDIDGTLLNENKEILLANLAAIDEYIAHGGQVTLVSGRIPASVHWHCNALGLSGPYGCLNGAIVGHRGKILGGQPFAKETVLTFLAYCRANHLYCHMYTDQAMIYDTPARWNRNWPMQNLSRLEGRPPSAELLSCVDRLCPAWQVADLAETVLAKDWPIYKLAVLSELPLDAAAAGLAALPGLTVSSSDPRNLEISPAGINKGTALAQIKNLLGLAREDIMAVGDNFNDLSLFAACGKSIAMGNAPETVRAAAQAVSKTNREAGVAYAINRWAYEEN